jgi:CheY-like chemotaxis protein
LLKQGGFSPGIFTTDKTENVIYVNKIQANGLMQFKAPHKELILLVEDNAVNCEVAVDMLEGMGFDVDVANNGQRAIELFNNNQYRLILMDCEMPVMDGFIATEHIRKIERELEKDPVPIIALTAHVIEESGKKCFASGMSDFLSKPFDIAMLQTVLNKWLNSDVNLVGNHQEVEYSDYLIRAASYGFRCNPAVLDCDILSKLYMKQKDDSSNIMINVIEAYIDQSTKLLNDLTEANILSDVEAVRRISHTLKSSSAHVGAITLSDLCKKIELRSKQGTIEDTLIQRVQQYYPEVEAALNDVLRCTLTRPDNGRI